MRTQHTTQPMTEQSRRPKASRLVRAARPAALGCALLSATALGCEDATQGAAAVEQAADTLQALHAGGADLPPTAVRKAAYENVAAQTSRAQGQAGVNAGAVAGLAGQATAGLADLAIADALRLEADLGAVADRLRADFDFRQSQLALARALEQQAAGIDVAAADSVIAQLDEELEAAKQRVADLEGQIAAIESDAAKANNDARAIRAEEGQLRALALAVEASEKAAILQQAFAVQRRADAREKESSKLTARAASIKPLLSEAQRMASGVETRLGIARRSRATLAERRSQLSADAADARASAVSAAERVVAAIDEIMSVRQSDLARAYQSAAEQLERAIASFSRSAREGGASSRSTTTMQRGVSAQRLGEALAARTDYVSMLASLLRVAQDAEPAFAPAQPVSEALESLDAERVASAQAAAQALADAVEAYESAVRSLSSEDRARVEELVSALRARIAALAGGGAPAD